MESNPRSPRDTDDVSHAALGRQIASGSDPLNTDLLVAGKASRPAVSQLATTHRRDQAHMPTKNRPGERPRRAIPWSQVRFALDSPLEEAGFELPVPPERKAALDRVRRPSVTLPSLQALRQGPRHALGRFDLRSRFRRVHCHQHRDGKHQCGRASALAPRDAKGG